jgi:hypothetical protein
MNIVDHETAFDAIIETRLRSDDWNLTTARSLLKRRRRKKYTITAAGLAASLAAAAFILSSLMPVSQSGIADGEELNNFIQAQVDGIWGKDSAGVMRIGNKEVLLVGAQYDASLEEMIEETLLERF